MKTKTTFLLSLFILYFIPGLAQSSGDVEVRGKVVEIMEGKVKGIKGVKVTISGDYDYTDLNGNFRLHLPTEERVVSIQLEQNPHPMIAPIDGKIALPVSGDLLIRLCSQKNKKLQQKVKNLEQRVNQLQKKNEFTERQKEQIYNQMLDTILHFEERISGLYDELMRGDSINEELRAHINKLENELLEKDRQLFAALEEKYLRQKSYLDEVSYALNNYGDEVKNLRDMMYPNQISYYFTNQVAYKKLEKQIEKYNEAYNIIRNDHDKHISGVKNYWPDGLDKELETTYSQLLDVTHDQGVLQLNAQVIEQMRRYFTGQKGRTRAQKDATKGAEQVFMTLPDYIDSLVKQSEEVIFKLRNHI